jgi:hypothetical protein
MWVCGGGGGAAVGGGGKRGVSMEGYMRVSKRFLEDEVPVQI